MPFIEAPTTFYLGRRFDPESQEQADEVVYYDSRDLTTHAVILGMTGSGKTGMTITLMEEAILDNIPILAIDPKGDLTNALLAFPSLSADDFRPWINIDDARRAGLDVEEFAQDIAQQWRQGLAGWSIVPQRIAAYKNAADFTIFTPGSDSGIPVSILQSFQAPREGWAGYEETHRERITGIVTALLALIGKQVEPVKDREHVLISNIFENAWRNGQDLTIEEIILQVQKPPFSKLGVFDVNTFFPEKDRFKLAMELNHIIAAPSFQSWINGEPMDMRRLLYTAEGRPRLSIFYLAHLTDAERTFIITLLLESLLAWMRSLSGTTSLRALLFFDEVFGHFPPAPYNPPTKQPLLRLLKQARAFGLGLVLATQNPGDLDYKGLSNAGTWIIGKLQTENDKRRVLSGLQSASTAESTIDVSSVDRLISTLAPRVFVMHNIHDRRGPILVHTRWTMSYLRGPLTRQQVRQLMEPKLRSMAGLYGEPMPTPYMPPSPSAYADVPAPTFPPPPPANLPGTQSSASVPPSTLPDMAPPPPSSLPGEAPVPQQGTQPIFRPFSSRAGVGTGTGAQSPSVGITPPTTPAPLPTEGFATPPAPAAPSSTSPSMTTRAPNIPDGYSSQAPVLSSSRAQYYLPTIFNVQQAIRNWEQTFGYQAAGFGGAQLLYRPVLLAQALVRYMDRKSGAQDEQRWAFHVPDVDAAGFVRWSDYQATPVDPAQVAQEPYGEAYYGNLAPGLSDTKRMAALKTDLTDFLYRTAAISLFYNSTLDVYGQPHENRRDFLTRIQQSAREARDQEIDVTTTKYDALITKLDEKLRKEITEKGAEQRVLDEMKREDLYTTGEAIMSLMRGRTAYTLSRMSRARRYKKQFQERSISTEQNIVNLEEEIDRKQQELQETLQGVNDKWAKIATTLEEVKVTPLKKDIGVELFGIGWVPAWYVVLNGSPVVLPAYPAKPATQE